MKAIKSIPEETVDAHIIDYTVKSITFIPGSFNVILAFDDADGNPQTLTADMTAGWAALNAAKKTDWKSMFRKIVAKCLGITVGEVVDDIWN